MVTLALSLNQIKIKAFSKSKYGITLTDTRVVMAGLTQ